MNEILTGDFPAEDLPQIEPDEAVETVLDYVARVNGSDIFFHMNEKSMEIAMRRLGTVQRLCLVPCNLGRHMISHVKALAGMNISEHRRPMDGRWIYKRGDRRLDLRINSVATLFGEDMTLRMWDQDGLRRIETLGLPRASLNTLTGLLKSPSGLILVTGPTGTGKTTTLYACLDYLNDGTRKISTLEDPVEYAIPRVRQVPVNHRLKLDFPELLRNVLRQAPDVIMIGEIRDEPTVTTAVRAANSGHLVLATLHSPVAAGAVQSMLALGAHPYFLSSCLLAVVAQRLIRTLCTHCRVAYDISEAPQTFDSIKSLLGPNEGKLIYGPGRCDQCFEVGYAQRTGLFEIMTMTREMRKMIAGERTTEEIEQEAIKSGMIEFRRSSMLKVAQGVTSMEEILRDVPPEYLGLED